MNLLSCPCDTPTEGRAARRFPAALALRLVLVLMSWALLGWLAPARSDAPEPPGSGALTAPLVLVMVEQAGCVYCRRWNAEVGPGYEASPEGAVAPLLRQDLRAPLPDGIAFAQPAVFTPTFILLRDGTEIGRIEGYAGAQFFWERIRIMIETESGLSLLH